VATGTHGSNLGPHRSLSNQVGDMSNSLADRMCAALRLPVQQHKQATNSSSDTGCHRLWRSNWGVGRTVYSPVT
jgi:hypothetical protein